ncbi:hypothetical protein B0I37DRAFT_428776 [Chaetomium sp. MPI-CAGE-AT-0009]|nr:hypothetical protein B0I37DRAFT_428776 [Chaetomium sp. MPI-CAGE-AT-0009]
MGLGPRLAHHFEHEENVGMNCLVRSTDFFYRTAADGVNTSIYTFLAAVEQCGYRRDSREPSGYVKRTVPRLEFRYTEPAVDDILRPLDPRALENVPDGLASGRARWIDLYGEGVSGILTETDGAWYYKRNVTPISDAVGDDGSLISHPMFDPLEEFKTMNLDADGFLSIVTEDGVAGCYQSDGNEDWQTWTPFDLSFKTSLTVDGLKLVDLTGDGHVDAILTDQGVWHSSLGRGGFGAPEGFAIAPGEFDSPAQLFKNKSRGRVRFYFADVTGDGLQDVVLVGNGEVCFWPNLGYGRFGERTTMDNAPVFDDDDHFDPKRIIFADIDGLSALQDVSPVDLHGNGTVCLVISDPLPARESAMRYVDLMGGIKPHLLAQFENNLGSSTKIHYGTSTKSYLRDKKAGKAWVSRLPYPVSVVDYTETYDHISRNVFTSSYAYHHGHYDGTEREFRGFGMVEQWDTEKLSPITFPDGGSNLDKETALPATHTKSWFHLGTSLQSEAISRHYEGEYYQHSALWLPPDTVLPADIEASEEYDAYRAMKGSLLRQETYMDDATEDSPEDEIERAGIPVSISERNYSLTRLQPGTERSSAVFTTAPREVFTFHLERNAQDPRVSHQITLERNEYGQTQREVAIGYGRRNEDGTLPSIWDKAAQTRRYLTYTENKVTNAIDDPIKFPHSYRLPINFQRREYELVGIEPPAPERPFAFEQFSADDFMLLRDATEIPHDAQADPTKLQKRLLVLARTICRSDDLRQLMPLGTMGVSGHIGRSYGLAFTAEQFDHTYQRNGIALVPSRDSVLANRGGNGGGYFSSSELKAQGLFPPDDPYDGYWTGTGWTFFSLTDDADAELAQARSRFYAVVRTRNVFGVESSVTYDEHDLLIVEATDSTGNVVTVGEREAGGARLSNGNDYRTLHPRLLTDANGNRSTVATDALGTVVGNAAMGKPGEPVGDSLVGFEPDLPESTVLAYLENPTADPKAILLGASERFVYDIAAYSRSKSSGNPQPAVAAAITRVTHETSLTDGDKLEMHHSFTYSDGFGRVIQAKVQSKPGPVANRDGNGHIILDDEGRPVMTDEPASPRWTASGWVIYNNKGLVVAQYEPFFTHLASYEFDVRAGISAVAFYDALGRAVFAVNPNGTFTKTLFTPWTKEVWDNNDTIELDPRTDPDVKQSAAAYFAARPSFKTWLETRMALPAADPRRLAANKARVHAGTPVISHFDCLERVYLKTGWNRVRCDEHELDGREWKQYTRIEFDIQSRGLAVRDADSESGGDVRGRIVETFQYNMLGEAMVRRSMDSGATLYLLNAGGAPFYQWDDRGHRTKTVYDKSGRHLFTSLTGDEYAPGGPASECIVSYNVYGEHHPSAAALNLRGKTWLVVDQAALNADEKRDFKGLLLARSKRLCADYKKTVDWTLLTAVVPPDMDSSQVVDEAALWAALDTRLSTERFHASTSYDGLNRPTELTSPNSDGNPSTTVFEYEINSIKRISAAVRKESANPLPVITSLDYDARGLRQNVSYANGVTIKYTYSTTGELLRLVSTRPATVGFDVLQDLRYTYDPSNRCVHIEDAAQQTLYFRNRVVEPVSDYTHDALYQLVRATGREHLGQPGGSPIPYSSDDSSRSGPQPSDGGAMGTYREDYIYDHCGNLKRMRHSVDDPSAPGHTWTREFAYAEPSTLEPSRTGNRLTWSSISGRTENYMYDAHGSVIRMPHLGGGPGGTANIVWNYANQQKEVDLGGGGRAYYVYNAAGQRERLYLDATLEVFRKHASGGGGGGGGSGRVTLERESFHVGDDQNRVALIETRTIDADGSDGAPRQLWRFQLANHQGSATVELDDRARLLSYEEYAPYGSTTHAGAAGSLELPKRYRFTGKERDEETGLSYHGARYYAPWLGRWTSADPGGGMDDGPNLYQYCLSNPVHHTDGNGGSPESGPPEWLRDIYKGMDAQEWFFEKIAAAEAAQKEIWIGSWLNEELKEGWEALKRFDIITKDRVIQVKYVELREAGTGAGKGAATLEQRIRSGLADAKKEVDVLKKYFAGSHGTGWANDRAAEMWAHLGPDDVPGHTLVFVVEGNAHKISQFRRLVAQTVDRVAKGHSVEVVEGSYRSFSEISSRLKARALERAALKAERAAAKETAERLAGKVVKGAVVTGAVKTTAKLASKLMPGVGLYLALKDLGEADNVTDGVIAGVEVVGSALEMVPGLNVIGTGINLAMLGTRVVVAAARYAQAESAGAGPASQPPAETTPAPTPETAPTPASTPGPAISKIPGPPGLFGPAPDRRSGSGLGDSVRSYQEQGRSRCSGSICPK